MGVVLEGRREQDRHDGGGDGRKERRMALIKNTHEGGRRGEEEGGKLTV